MQTASEQNPKRRDIREDGYIFRGYVRRKGKAYEQWLSPDAFQRQVDSHIECNKVYQKRIRATAPQIARGYYSRWIAQNLAKKLEINSRYRARRSNQTRAQGCPKLMKCFYTLSERVSKCIGIPHHVDHIIPLAKNGAHHHTNLQMLPARINLRKSDKLGFSIPSHD
jgi:5-methylcytosine-specific restriction endonuclease McrA